MMLSDVSIRRPVLTCMMILALLVFGLLGYSRLGIDHFYISIENAFDYVWRLLGREVDGARTAPEAGTP